MRNTILAVLVCAVAIASVPAEAGFTTTARQAAFGTYDDIEPTIMSQVRSGVEHQVAVWMQFPSTGQNSPAKLHYNHYNVSTGNARGAAIPLHAGYNFKYADPFLAQNKAATNYAQRIYLIGVAHNGAATDSSAVLRWYSDNGGYSWSSPLEVDKYVGTDGVTGRPPATYLLDKTHIAVSSSSKSPGWVYVTYVRRNNTNSSKTHIMVALSKNGGATFETPVEVTKSEVATHQVPQVVVDENTGDVYVVWSQWTGSTQYMHAARAACAGMTCSSLTNTSFSEPESITPAGRLLTGAVDFSGTISLATGVTMRATSAPIARIDSARRRIGVAWHQRRASDNTFTDIVFRKIDITEGTPVWDTSDTIISNENTHQLQPSMDFDTDGNYMVAYYLFGSGQTYYWNVAKWVAIDGSGNITVDANDTALSDPSEITLMTKTGTVYTLGEYHDVSYSNGTFKTVGILISGYPNPEVFTSTHY